MSTKIIMRNRMLKGAICLAAAVIAIIFHDPQTAHAKTIKITAESGKGRDIQNALNASRQDSKNLYIVKVPEGTHRLDRELYIPSNTTLDLRAVTEAGKISRYWAVSWMREPGGMPATSVPSPTCRT